MCWWLRAVSTTFTELFIWWEVRILNYRSEAAGRVLAKDIFKHLFVTNAYGKVGIHWIKDGKKCLVTMIMLYSCISELIPIRTLGNMMMQVWISEVKMATAPVSWKGLKPGKTLLFWKSDLLGKLKLKLGGNKISNSNLLCWLSFLFEKNVVMWMSSHQLEMGQAELEENPAQDWCSGVLGNPDD